MITNKKKFIAVIGVSGAGKTTFINDKFADLPIWDSCEDSQWVFHDKVFFVEAILHISGFEEVVMEHLIENTINKGHGLEVYYLYLDTKEIHVKRVRERAIRTGGVHENGLDVSDYAVSKNVFDRTKNTMKKFIKEYKGEVKFHVINNSQERDTN